MKGELVTLASIALLACAGEPSSGQTDGSFPFGEVSSSCAPWDGAAVSLILTRDEGGAQNESYPRISIMVYRGMPDVLGQSFSFEAGSQEVGGSSFCAAADGCESVPNTTVRFGVLQHGDSVSGSYDLDLGKGRMERGRFHATVADRPAFCG